MMWPMAVLMVAPPASEGFAAYQVVKDYYAAIDARDYRRAYRLWSGGRSFAEMRAGYLRTRRVSVSAPQGVCLPEGAAGSLYCETIVEVDSVLVDGRHQRFRGSFTLRRVNHVDGATSAQRRWHISGAKLKLAA